MLARTIRTSSTSTRTGPTRADLDVHLNLPYQKEWFGRHDEFLAKPVELRFFEMLSEYDKR